MKVHHNLAWARVVKIHHDMDKDNEEHAPNMYHCYQDCREADQIFKNQFKNKE